jgi:hypothetical protein
LIKLWETPKPNGSSLIKGVARIFYRRNKMYINRNYERTEHDDYTLNVEPRLSGTLGAVQIYDGKGVIVGWEIKSIYE